MFINFLNEQCIKIVLWSSPAARQSSPTTLEREGLRVPGPPLARRKWIIIIMKRNPQLYLSVLQLCFLHITDNWESISTQVVTILYEWMYYQRQSHLNYLQNSSKIATFQLSTEMSPPVQHYFDVEYVLQPFCVGPGTRSDSWSTRQFCVKYQIPTILKYS
jgi:hypothetical protein